MGKKLTTEIFIERSRKIHGNKYDYSLVNYINKRTKVTIICSNHEQFEQLPYSHMIGNGCGECFNKGKSNTNDFIKKSKVIHGNKYDYSLVNYIKAKKNVTITCPIHGPFEQLPNYHLSGSGCIYCSGRYNKKEEFENNGNIIHSNKYDYSLVDYKNNKTNVTIICPIHGPFEQRPDNHIHGYGCLSCNESSGEKIIIKYLTINNIKYIREKRFINCKYKRTLPFDFYLSEHNICIEFDGDQHFKSIDFFGGDIEFNKLQIKDNIKNEYCKNNNIHLIRFNNSNIYQIESILKIPTVNP